MTAQDRKPIALVAFGALGVVFGDIGTSPLYAVRQVFHDTPGFAHDPGAILGVLSLILWSIGLVVCVKYVGFAVSAGNCSRRIACSSTYIRCTGSAATSFDEWLKVALSTL